MSDISQVLGVFTHTKGYNDSEVEEFTKEFTFNETLNAYILEVDLSELDEACQYKCEIQAYIDDTPFTYSDSDFYFYRNPEFITDRKQEDVDQAKELRAKWLNDSISQADMLKWNIGLKGCINNSDITRIGTKHSQIEQYFNAHVNDYISQYSSIIGTYLYTSTGFNNMRQTLTALKNTVDSLNDTQRVLFATINDLKYEEIPPSLPFNYYEKWNDIEKLILAYFRTLIYDIQAYKPASITKYEPEPPYTYINYLYMTDNESDNELHMVATDDEMIGLI